MLRCRRFVRVVIRFKARFTVSIHASFTLLCLQQVAKVLSGTVVPAIEQISHQQQHQQHQQQQQQQQQLIDSADAVASGDSVMRENDEKLCLAMLGQVQDALARHDAAAREVVCIWAVLL